MTLVPWCTSTWLGHRCSFPKCCKCVLDFESFKPWDITIVLCFTGFSFHFCMHLLQEQCQDSIMTRVQKLLYELCSALVDPAYSRFLLRNDIDLQVWFCRKPKKWWRCKSQLGSNGLSRLNLVGFAKEMFRSKYEELKQRSEAAKSKRSTLQTDHYEASTWAVSFVACECIRMCHGKLPVSCQSSGQSKARACALWWSQTTG